MGDAAATAGVAARTGFTTGAGTGGGAAEPGAGALNKPEIRLARSSPPVAGVAAAAAAGARLERDRAMARRRWPEPLLPAAAVTAEAVAAEAVAAEAVAAAARVLPAV